MDQMINLKTVNGLTIPILGFGTWKMGGEFEPDPNNDDAADIKAIR